jgi:TolB protein
MKLTHIVVAAFAALLILLGIAVAQQRPDIDAGTVRGSQIPRIALPDLKGTGAAVDLMPLLNQTLYADIEMSGVFEVKPKSMYPLQVPQRREDFRTPSGGQRYGNGLFLRDWSQPPVEANWLAIGYAAEQNGRLVLFGYLYNVNADDIANAEVFGKMYFGALSDAGARDVAHEFAADILKQFGAMSLAGTRIYFISNRTGNDEVWTMNYDGTDQRQFTSLGSISLSPTVSRDGNLLAFTTFKDGTPGLMIYSTETQRRMPFVNPVASMNATPEFSPDASQLYFASTADGKSAQIYVSGINGAGLRRLTHSGSVEVSPRVNPKTGADILFVSGRRGTPQIFKMTLASGNTEMLTPGEGEAHNPSWHPDGEFMTFAWSRGYEPGNFNIFVMDTISKQYTQLTYGTEKNENPCFSPDGKRIVFASSRTRQSQIYTMRADGTGVQQLTSAGRNRMPVWSVK